MNRAERRRRSANAIKRRRKFWEKHMSLNRNILTGEIDKPIEEFTWLKTTGKPCSCQGCGNPRKHFKDKTVQEKRADHRFREELVDAA